MKKIFINLLSKLLIIFILSNCTSNRLQRNDRPINLEKWLVMNAPPQICLAGEGKGRAVSRQGEKIKKLAFDYTSLWRSPDIWLLAIDISLHGEETLFFTRDEKQIKLSGTLEKYFNSSEKNSKNPWGKLLFAIKAWSEIPHSEKQKIYPSPCNGMVECKWKWRSLDFDYSQNSLTIAANGISLLLKDWSDEFKKFDSQFWASKDQSATDSSYLELELRPVECSEK